MNLPTRKTDPKDWSLKRLKTVVNAQRTQGYVQIREYGISAEIALGDIGVIFLLTEDAAERLEAEEFLACIIAKDSSHLAHLQSLAFGFLTGQAPTITRDSTKKAIMEYQKRTGN